MPDDRINKITARIDRLAQDHHALGRRVRTVSCLVTSLVLLAIGGGTATCGSG